MTEHTRFDSGNDNRDKLPRFTGDALRAIVEELHRFGRTRGVTSAQGALAWLLGKKPWIVPIPGTTKLAHLEENLKAAGFAFGADAVHELEDAVSNIQIGGDRYPASEQNDLTLIFEIHPKTGLVEVITRSVSEEKNAVPRLRLVL